jgi:hypothetical protein
VAARRGRGAGRRRGRSARDWRGTPAVLGRREALGWVLGPTVEIHIRVDPKLASRPSSSLTQNPYKSLRVGPDYGSTLRIQVVALPRKQAVVKSLIMKTIAATDGRGRKYSKILENKGELNKIF